MVFSKFPEVCRRIVARVLDDAFANFESQIQAWKIEISLLELLHDSQRMQVVIEAVAVIAHQFVEAHFAGMSKWRMSDIVHQGKRFGQFGIQAECLRHGARNLSDLDGVRQAIPEMIGVAGRKDLRLCL